MGYTQIFKTSKEEKEMKLNVTSPSGMHGLLDKILSEQLVSAIELGLANKAANNETEGILVMFVDVPNQINNIVSHNVIMAYQRAGWDWCSIDFYQKEHIVGDKFNYTYRVELIKQ